MAREGMCEGRHREGGGGGEARNDDGECEGEVGGGGEGWRSAAARLLRRQLNPDEVFDASKRSKRHSGKAPPEPRSCAPAVSGRSGAPAGGAILVGGATSGAKQEGQDPRPAQGAEVVGTSAREWALRDRTSPSSHARGPEGGLESIGQEGRAGEDRLEGLSGQAAVPHFDVPARPIEEGQRQVQRCRLDGGTPQWARDPTSQNACLQGADMKDRTDESPLQVWIQARVEALGVARKVDRHQERRGGAQQVRFCRRWPC